MEEVFQAEMQVYHAEPQSFETYILVTIVSIIITTIVITILIPIGPSMALSWGPQWCRLHFRLWLAIPSWAYIGIMEKKMETGIH